MPAEKSRELLRALTFNAADYRKARSEFLHELRRGLHLPIAAEGDD
jgi:hypothetical protein